MFEDLVLKAQGIPKADCGSFAILPTQEFCIASAMKDKGLLSAKQITSFLDFSASKVSSLIHVMCLKGIIDKKETVNRQLQPYLYTLAVERFALKGASYEQAS